MSDYKELVRRLQMHPPQETPFVCADAIRAIEKLSAEVERYRESDLSEAVQRLDETKEAEIKRLKQERDEAREKAKALDELEALLRCPERSEAVLGRSVSGWSCDLWRAAEFRHVVDRAPTLAAAIRAALEKEKASRQGGQ